MNWKLRALLWFVNHVQPIREVGIEHVNTARKASLRASELGKLLFDKKTPVKDIRNFKIGHIPVRLYRNSTEPDQKVILYFHGGGFVYYNIDSHDYVARRLCVSNNCTVISVDYRLAPEHTFPAAHEDAYQVVDHVYAHASELGVDATKIMVAGDSAGGNLAACCCHHFKNHPEIKLAAQVLIYPWVDGKIDSPSIEQYKQGYLLTKEAMLWFQKTYSPNPEDQCNPELSPLYQPDMSGLPPAFVLTAEFDPLKDEGKWYADKMRDAGNTVWYRDYKQLVHGFLNIPGLSDEGRQAFEDIRKFIREEVK